MKNLSFISFLFALLASFFLLQGCDKLSSDTELAGRWQLTRIVRTDAASGTSTEIEIPQPTYWSFNLSLLSVTTPNPHNGHTAETLARYSRDAASLRLPEIYIHFRDRDSLLTDPEQPQLLLVGIDRNPTAYTVRFLSERKMTLDSDRTHLVFRKIGF